MERFWPDLAHYRLACWIEALPDTEPRQYRFRLMPIGPMTAREKAIAQEALAPLADEWGAKIQADLPEGVMASWTAPKVPSSAAFLRLLPAAVIRPLEGLAQGPWWRDRPTQGSGAQWLWRVNDAPVSRLLAVPGRYGQVPYELWTETPEMASRYSDQCEPVTRAEAAGAAWLCGEPRNGGRWVLPQMAQDANRVVVDADYVAVPPPLPATTLSDRADFGEKIGGARKDTAGGRLSAPDSPQDWMERAQTVLPLVREAAKKVRREQFWPVPSAEERAVFFAAGGEPVVWLAREAIRCAVATSPASLASVKRAAGSRFRSDTGKAQVLAAAAFYYPRLVGHLRDQVQSWMTLADMVRCVEQDRRRQDAWHRSPSYRFFGHTNLAQSWEALDIAQWVGREADLEHLIQEMPPTEVPDTLAAMRAPLARLWQSLADHAALAPIMGALEADSVSAQTVRAAREEAYTLWTRVAGQPPSRSLDSARVWPLSIYTWQDLVLRLICLSDLVQHTEDAQALRSRIEAAPAAAPPETPGADDRPSDATETTGPVPDPMIGRGLPKRLIPSPRFANLTRMGPVRRSGPVTEAYLAETFGLRAIEYGNWVKDADRQAMLDLAFDSLSDMAVALDVPPEAMGFHGELALALGARGRGGHAAAHYEPARRVINLTKTMGAGTLAHEWSHALDHWLVYRNEPGSPVLATTRRHVEDSAQDPSLRALRAFQDTLRLRSEAAVAEAVPDRFVTQMLESALLAPTLAMTPADAARVVSAWVRDAVIPLMAQAGPSPSTLAALFCEPRASRWLYSHKVGVASCRDWVTQHPEVGAWTPDIEKALADFLLSHRPGQPCFPYPAFRALWKKLGAMEREGRFTHFYRSALHLDANRQAGYWSSPHEMFARGFSAVLHDRMADLGIVNDFASRFSAPNEFTDDKWRASPNPEGAERQHITAAARAFCDQMRGALSMRPVPAAARTIPAPAAGAATL